MTRDTKPVRLSAAQHAYLGGAGFLPPDLREIAASVPIATASGGVTVEMDRDVAERFRSAFTERLAQVGFDRNYELTEEGIALEGLIDAFYSGTD